MRHRGDRRLTSIIVAIERRKAARRDLGILRRTIEDRRKLEMKVGKKEDWLHVEQKKLRN